MASTAAQAHQFCGRADINSAWNRRSLDHAVGSDYATTTNMSTRQDFGAGTNPDIILDHYLCFPQGLVFYWNRRIIEAMLEGNDRSLRCYPHAVSDAYAPVAKQHRMVIERNIVSDLDAPALGVNYDAVAHRDAITDRYRSFTPPETRPIQHFGLCSDGEATSGESCVEFDQPAKVHFLHRSKIRIDREGLVQPLLGILDILPVAEPRAAVGVVNTFGIASGRF